MDDVGQQGIMETVQHSFSLQCIDLHYSVTVCWLVHFVKSYSNLQLW